MRGDSGFLHRAERERTIAGQNDESSRDYPSVLIEGHLVHVYQRGGEWDVWINTEDLDFTGLCIGTGTTRDQAIGHAVKALEAITEKLQGPPW